MHRSAPVTAFAALSLPALLMLPFAGSASAQEASEQRQPIVRVSAVGEATAAPDMAIVTFSVVRSDKTAQVAVDENSSAMNAVMAALKSEGVEAADLQTTNFSIYPQYRHSEPKDGVVEPPEVVGYEVTNTLTVRIRDIAKVGAILDQSVKLGINQGGQIVFTNDNPEEALTEARKQAVERALAKARTLTEAAGVKLGRVLQIDERTNAPMPPQPMFRMAMAKEASDAVPVAAGENTYSVSVDVTYTLDQ
jgi:uncharacterized protein YggE